MIMPPKYASLNTVDELLVSVLLAYPTAENVLNSIIDGSSDEYKAFHILSLKSHVTMIHVRQFGVTYQLSRVSNIRGSTGYERYVKSVWTKDPLQEDERIVTYKTFINKWLPWVTVKL